MHYVLPTNYKHTYTDKYTHTHTHKRHMHVRVNSELGNMWVNKSSQFLLADEHRCDLCGINFVLCI